MHFQSVDYPGGVYLVGDIHGDLLVLLEAGNLSGTFCTNENNGLQELLVHRDTKTTHNLEKLTNVHWCASYTKEGQHLPKLLIFLGDVIDNYRNQDGVTLKPSANNPMANNPLTTMATNHEELIMQTIAKLQTEAKNFRDSTKSEAVHDRVVFIAGNHEIGNVNSDLICQDYTSVLFCTKDGQKYNQSRARQVRQWLRDIDSLVVCMVDNAVICHGGIPPKLSTKFGKLNDCYRQFLCNQDMHLSQDVSDVIWHRPTKLILRDVRAVSNRKANCLIVGHQIQKSLVGAKMIIRRKQKNTQLASKRVELAGCLIYLDFAMSRAFNTGLDPKQETYCLLAVARLHTNQTIQYLYKTHPRCRPDQSFVIADGDRKGEYRC